MLRPLVFVLGALASSLLLPSFAQAGTVSVSGTTITFVAQPGEANFLTVNWGNGAFGYPPSIDDHVPIEAVAPCAVEVTGVQCPTAGMKPTYVVRLGDGNDIARSINDEATGTHTEFYGEDGNDDLSSGAGGDTLDGGPGDDTLTPDDEDPAPGDVVVGGAGRDTLKVGDSGTGLITATLDGVADDGFPGDADNYAADLEDLSATGVSPSVRFVGTEGPNTVVLRSDAPDTVSTLGGEDRIEAAGGNDAIDAGAGADTIIGGSGDDTITGGPGVDSITADGEGGSLYTLISGNDRIDARDGEAESVNCGPGADTAIIDAADLVPADPQTACETVDRAAAAAGPGPTTPTTPGTPAPSGPSASPSGPVAPAIRSSSLVYRDGRIAVSLRCAAGAARCRGKLTVRTASRVRLGSRRKVVTVLSATYSVVAGRTASVKAKPSADGRALLRRTTRVKVKVTSAPTGGGKATTRTVNLR